MAKTINIDGVNFTNINRIGQGSAFNNVINGDIRDESDLQDYIDAGEEYRNIQSVLIDWNGAKPGMGEGENGINTTGELLSLLKNYAASKESINWDDVDLSYIGLDIDDNITKLESISDLVDLLAVVYNSTQQNKYDVEVENVSGNNVLIFK